MALLQARWPGGVRSSWPPIRLDDGDGGRDKAAVLAEPILRPGGVSLQLGGPALVPGRAEPERLLGQRPGERSRSEWAGPVAAGGRPTAATGARRRASRAQRWLALSRPGVPRPQASGACSRTAGCAPGAACCGQCGPSGDLSGPDRRRTAQGRARRRSFTPCGCGSVGVSGAPPEAAPSPCPLPRGQSAAAQPLRWAETWSATRNSDGPQVAPQDTAGGACST
jgi:hypothetical protein